MKKHYTNRTSLVALFLAVLSSMSINIEAKGWMNREDKKVFNAAFKMAQNTDNLHAIALFRKLYEKNPNDIDVAYNLGLCYMNGSLNPDSAMFFLNIVNDLDEGEWHEGRTDLKLAMARIHQLKYEYDEALDLYREIQTHDTTGYAAKRLAYERNVCSTAQDLLSMPVMLKTKLVAGDVNSEYNDYRPIVSADMQTLIFTSRRKDVLENSPYDDGQYEEKLYIVKRDGYGDWGSANRLNVLSKRGAQETAVSISEELGELYLCSEGDIYISRRDSATGNWLPAQPIGDPINTKSEERFASISPDGQQLLFSSNREGGMGGFDIYRSFRLPNGHWGEPRNVGPEINSEYDEDSPVFHPTQPLLYFSSAGHNTMGGMDIFYSQINEEDSSFVGAMNIGYPINTPDDDLYFIPTSKQNIAYYSSIKWNNSNTGYNIYEVEYDEPEVNRLVLIEGKVVAANPADVRITARVDGNIVGTYLANERTGSFVMLLDDDQNYEIYAEAYGEVQKRQINLEKGAGYNLTGEKRTIEPFVFHNSGGFSMNTSIERENFASENFQSTLPTGRFTVQILSLKRPVSLSSLPLESHEVYEISYKNGWYVYAYGSYEHINEARSACKYVHNNTKFADSFIRNSKQYKRYTK